MSRLLIVKAEGGEDCDDRVLVFNLDTLGPKLRARHDEFMDSIYRYDERPYAIEFWCGDATLAEGEFPSIEGLLSVVNLDPIEAFAFEFDVVDTDWRPVPSVLDFCLVRIFERGFSFRFLPEHRSHEYETNIIEWDELS